MASFSNKSLPPGPASAWQVDTQMISDGLLCRPQGRLGHCQFSPYRESLLWGWEVPFQTPERWNVSTPTSCTQLH